MGCGVSKPELSDAEAVADDSVSRRSLSLPTPSNESDKTIPLPNGIAATKATSKLSWSHHGTNSDVNTDLSDPPESRQGSWTILEQVTRKSQEESPQPENVKKPLSTVRKALKVTKLSGCTLLNQYLVVQFLGKGTSGRVYLCMDILEMKLYAVKIVKKKVKKRQYESQDTHTPGEATTSVYEPATPTSIAKLTHNSEKLIHIQREIAAMRKVGSHPNLVGLREVVDDESSNKLLLVMDYWEGGPIMPRPALEKGRCIPEPVARRYFRDLAAGLARLHEKGIIHGDLKPENALMSADGRVALSDFGCSRSYVVHGEYDNIEYGDGTKSPRPTAHGDSPISSHMPCNGTPAFLAPELMCPLKERPSLAIAGCAADVYALGTSLFACIYGRIPFAASSVPSLFNLVKTQPLTFPDEPEVSPELIDLLNGMLAKDADHRLTLEAVLSHRWMNGGSGDKEHHMVENAMELDPSQSLNRLVHVQGARHTFHRAHLVNEWLFRQGESGDVLYYVDSGIVEIWYAPMEGGTGAARVDSRKTSSPDQSTGLAKVHNDEEHVVENKVEKEDISKVEENRQPKLWTPTRKSSSRLATRKEWNESATSNAKIPPLSLTGKLSGEESPITPSGRLFSSSARSVVTTPATTPIPSARSFPIDVQDETDHHRDHSTPSHPLTPDPQQLEEDGGMEEVARKARHLLKGLKVQRFSSVDRLDQVDEVSGTEQYRIAIRGQGEFLGETPFVGGEDTLHPVSARTKDAVILKIPYSEVRGHCLSYPLAQQKLAELEWKRQSEIIVLESLLRMAGACPKTSSS